MMFWLVVAGLVIVVLAGGWYVDRRAARNGYRVSVRHTGLRREVTYHKIGEKDPEEDDR